jgi:fido (protein-threonine AMPylation protein)
MLEVGYIELIRHFRLRVLPPHRYTYIADIGRGAVKNEEHKITVILPKPYALKTPDNALHQLEFALKHEGVNLEIISACFAHIHKDDITHFINEKPAGKFRRILWFLFEFLGGEILDLDDAKQIPYVDLLDPKKYIVGKSIKSRRHAINNNLLGNKGFCPIVRKTALLDEFIGKNISLETEKLMKSVDPVILARAINYLYTKETKSSFGIEKITPSLDRMARFINLLEKASENVELNKGALIALQNDIVSDLYKDADYRKSQNYVGELTQLYQQKIHYISPKPEDLKQLMSDYIECQQQLLADDVHPVVVAAILSFGFVFLHPFEDGNGRIHRYIIHYILSKTKFTPDNIIFPVSSVMLKNLRQYDAMLELFSKPLLNAIDNYELNDAGELSVKSDTKKFYQYIDFTFYAEYLFSCIEKTIEEDFRDELDFITRYDRTKRSIQSIVDMPDFKIDRAIRCIAENNGKLGSKMRRTYFSELSDDTVSAIEKVIREGMPAHAD